MSWLFEAKRYYSPNNGVIVCRRFLGQWWVFVEGYDQSSPYIKNMWRGALRRLPLNFTAGRVLLLGLGAGSIINDLHSRFVDASITAVDYDAIMVNIAKELQLFDQSICEVIIGDVTDVVPKLDSKFDLIVVDLYRGNKTAPILEDDKFLNSISQKLSATGHLLLNVFENTPLLSKFDQHFIRKESWTFQYNTLALYSPHKTS